MGIDFNNLVLGPCMDAFYKSCLVTPVKSQPMAIPYPARGVWTTDNINVATDDGGSFSSRVLKYGIKIDEFMIPPVQHDVLTFKVSDLPMGYLRDALNPTATVDFLIDNDQPDGQGGSTLILKRKM